MDGHLNDQLELQKDLNTLIKWSAINNQPFNVKKFIHLGIGRSLSTPMVYKYNDVEIQKEEVVRDLGILFSADAKFANHIKKLVSDGQRLSGYVLRTFKTRDRYLMGTLLRSLVVSQMEYGCVIWSPTDSHLIKLLESVQRRFTSRISEFNQYDEALGMMICRVNYWQRLKRLRIFSLERHRESSSRRASQRENSGDSIEGLCGGLQEKAGRVPMAYTGPTRNSRR